MGRSTAYWAANPYRLAEPEPLPGAPLEDLPGAVAGRFRAARTGLLELPSVVEQIRFMGSPWGWAWEYAVGQRKLCWLHPIPSAVSATFTLTVEEEGKVAAQPRLSSIVRDALRDGQRTGPVKWCWIELTDRRRIDAFLGLARRKVEWLAERPPVRRGSKV
jgi:hypothetical protein